MDATFECEGDDDDEPVFVVEELTDDLWSRAAKLDAGDTTAEPIDMFDAELSLWMTNDLSRAYEYWERHKDRYPTRHDVTMRIDWGAAIALEERLVREGQQRRNEMLEEIKNAPVHSGYREDGDLLRDLVRHVPQVLSFRRKQVFELCIERGFSVNQCAKALGIGKETVRTHLRRLREKAPAAWRQPQR